MIYVDKRVLSIRLLYRRTREGHFGPHGSEVVTSRHTILDDTIVDIVEVIIFIQLRNVEEIYFEGIIVGIYNGKAIVASAGGRGSHSLSSHLT